MASLALCVGCGGGDSDGDDGAGDVGYTDTGADGDDTRMDGNGPGDASTGDGAAEDAMAEDAAGADAGAGDAGTPDTTTDAISADATDAAEDADVAEGCFAPTHVVANELSLDVEVDLTSYGMREYTVRQQVVVRPTAPGESISLYGASLLLGDASVPYRYDGNVVTFCTGPFDAGDEVAVTAEFVISEAHQGFPPGSLAGMRVWGPPDGDFAIGPFSSPFFASTWLLVPQTMTWFSSEHDGNTIADRVELTVIVPDAGWRVIGPGPPTQQGTEWAFTLDQPTPLYALSFAASPRYELLDVGESASGVRVVAGVTAASKSELADNLQAASTALDWMAEHVGPYAWGSQLAFAEIPSFQGGMEHSGAVWLGSKAIDGSFTGDYVAVHEAIHHWWGNHVQFADWPDFWLSEGFAEWTTIFAILENTSDATAVANLQKYYREQAAVSSQPPTPGAPLPGPLRFSDESDIMAQVSSNLLFFYYYGAAFLEMVNQRLIRDHQTDLVTVLAAWNDSYGGTRATTEDFRDLLVTLTGTAESWQQLFDEWVYQGPAPTLDLTNYDYADGVATVTLTRQAGADQDLSTLEVAFTHGATKTITTVALPSGTGSVTAQAEIDSPPDAIVVDPTGLYILLLTTVPDFAGPPVGITY